MQATLQTVSSTMTVVRDPVEIQAAMNNQLEISGKRVLVTKGNDMAKTVEFVYKAFADHRDLSGEPFLLSSKLKGLCHRDAWGSITKISAHDYQQYLTHWLVFAELRTSSDGTHLHLTNDNPALAISRICPPFSVQLWSQSRWLTAEIASWFQWLEQGETLHEENKR
jgi:hypothetical protein